MKKNKDYTVSSGNIFKDLGVVNPEERLAKAELAYQINTLIRERSFTQQQAAKLLGVDQPKISSLFQGKLSGFSLERLFNFLNLLDQKITITITPQKRSNKKHGVTITFTNLKKLPPKKPAKSENGRTIQAKKRK
jgi:predicted XRE-type DNA-binding protein